VPSNLAFGTGDTSVDEVSKQNYRQCQSYHEAPSFRLSGYIDPQIASLMFIFVFTLEIFLAGINVSLDFFVGLILNFIFSHGITSLVD
jgi:hypothetical protein